MKRPRRLVLDTNVFISVFLLRGRSSALVPALLSKRIVLLVSKEILKEYFEVSIRAKFGHSPQKILQLLEGIRTYTELITSKGTLSIGLRDEKDLKFLECAVSGHADWIISGDQDLLAVKRVGGIPIVTVAELARRLE